MAGFDDDACDGYRLEAYAQRLPADAGFVAQVVVRQLPAMEVVFEDPPGAATGVWAAPQQALVAALERGRCFVLMRARGKVMQAASGISRAPDDA